MKSKHDRYYRKQVRLNKVWAELNKMILEELLHFPEPEPSVFREIMRNGPRR